MKTAALLLFLLTPIFADYLTGLPSDTTYAEVMVEIAKIYNEASCNGVYGTNYIQSVQDNQYFVYNEIQCNGQTFKIYGQGNGMNVIQPIPENNYTGIDLESVTACGKAGGCLELLYVGSELPVAYNCTAYTKPGATVSNCTSCSVCPLQPIVEVTINCDNVNSNYTTPETCMVPFTNNDTVMGISGSDGSGGSGSGSDDSQHWSRKFSMLISCLISTTLLWM